jgi:putative heme transporter
VTPGSFVLVILALAAAVAAAEVVVAARTIVSWVVACAVAAALIELGVQFLDRYMRRAIAVVLVLLAIAGVTGLLVWKVFGDLDHEVARVQADAPVAAHQVEQSKRFGKVAREVRLQERVTSAVGDLSKPSSGLAGRAVSSVGTYTVCAILTILFLSWGPRVLNSAVSQLPTEQSSAVRRVAEDAFRRARQYVSLVLVQAAAVGILGYLACKWADIPAPAPLALGLTVMSLLPNLGIILGALPILLLAYGFSDSNISVTLTVAFAALQSFSSHVVQPFIVRRSNLHVGPAIIAVAFLMGFELYGLGGALYAAALAVLGIAALDAKADHYPEGPDTNEVPAVAAAPADAQ